MGGRGSSYSHGHSQGEQVHLGKLVEGSGHAGIDKLARQAGFARVEVSEKYAKRADSNKHAPQMLGAMLHDIGKVERVFHVLQNNKTALIIGKLDKETLAAMRNDNAQMIINSDMSSKRMITTTRNGIKSGWFSKSGNTKKVNNLVAHTPLHEYGHAVANDFRKKTGKDLARSIQRELSNSGTKKNSKRLPTVSKYGKESRHEWVAETFAQAFGPGGISSEATRALKRVLRNEGGYNV